MNKHEFFSRLAEVFPNEFYCNALEIRFQVPNREVFSEAVKTSVEAVDKLGKDWQCEPKIGVNPAFLSITVSFDV